MSGDPDSEKILLRNELERSNRQLLLSLQHRMDALEDDVRKELREIDDRIQGQLERSELHIADLAVNKAVKQAFAHLGVDVDDPKDLQTFRDDLRFGGVFRAAFAKSFFAFVAALFGGIGLSIWLAFKNQLGWK